MTFVMWLVLLAVGFGGWMQGRLQDRRALVDDPEAEALVRESFAARLDDTQPIDVVDGPWNRTEREIHHMSVPEFTDVNARFVELIAANWPNQT